MPRVPTITTPVDIATLDLGRPGIQRALLRTHVHIETRGGQAVHNNNVGNLIVPASQQDRVDYWAPPWRDDDTHPLHQLMLDGKEPSGFRAYPTLEAGVRDYVSLLERRFPSMLAATTPAEFTRAWRDSGYTPRLNVAATTRTVEQLLPRYLADQPRVPSADRDGWAVVLGSGIVAGALALLAHSKGWFR